jgi:hypothetical protein
VASYVQPTLGLNAMGNNLVLDWPKWAGTLNLYSATNPAPPVAWTVVTNAPLATNGSLILSVTTTNPSQFYRLQSQP